jgi:hypothetical protein
MNERIKELAEQAELHLELQSLKVEKFAELIVKECAGIAETAEPYQSSDLIKQHFGVEE